MKYLVISVDGRCICGIHQPTGSDGCFTTIYHWRHGRLLFAVFDACCSLLLSFNRPTWPLNYQ